MAILTGTTLTGCSSIPSFIPSGTVTLFQSTSAPTSWTKDTTSHNNKALRIVSGSITNGGSNPFTVAFSTNTVPWTGSTASNIAAPYTTTSTPSGLQFNQSTATILMGTATLSGNPPHTHSYFRNSTAGRASGGTTAYAGGVVAATSTATGGGGTHAHTLPTTTLAQHAHGDQTAPNDFGGTHSHTLTDLTHSHTISGSGLDMNVLYVDVILASKN